MSADPFKLGVWMRGHRKAQSFRLSLVAKLEQGDQFSPITDWPAPGADVAAVERVVGEILEQATADAATFPGRLCTYVLEAMGEGDQAYASRRFNARSEMGASSGGPTESPSPHGLVSQLMRHIEAQSRLQAEAKVSILDDAKQLFGMFWQMIGDARTENAALRGRERETIELYARLQAGTQQYELQKLELEAGTKSSADAKAKLWGIVTPVLMSKLGAAPPAPGAPSPASMGDAAPLDPVARDLVMQLVQHQIPLDGFFATAPPETQAAFAIFLKRYLPHAPAPSAPAAVPATAPQAQAQA